jgi:hypothetical protein
MKRFCSVVLLVLFAATAPARADIWARIIAEHLSTALKQSVVVEKRADGVDKIMLPGERGDAIHVTGRRAE